MPTLQDVVREHLEITGKSARVLADEANISFPILQGILQRGTIPRKPQHRERLRLTLGIEEKRWGAVLLASTQVADEPADGSHLNLQQLVGREMYAQGHTEQSLAKAAGLPYPTVMGITRKSSIPRADSLAKLAKALSVPVDRILQAAEASRASRQTGEERAHAPAAEGDAPPLSDLVMDLINNRKQSIAAFAADLKIGYLTLARFIETGQPPKENRIIEALRKALELETGYFDAALARSRDNPQPVEDRNYDRLVGPSGSQLQNALASFMREQKLTLKGLARKADLSQVTISRLLKQGQPPTRAVTHRKLQKLLGLDPMTYDALINQPTAALTASHRRKKGKKDMTPDDYEPHPTTRHQTNTHIEAADADEPDDDLADLIAALAPEQRSALAAFIRTMVKPSA